jgi:hypothetical protein
MRMGRPNPRGGTPEWYQRYHKTIRATCRTCGHYRRVDPEVLVYFGVGTIHIGITQKRMRCSKCGKKACTLAEEPARWGIAAPD